MNAIQLLVMGDSHVTFWTGSQRGLGRQALPGVATIQIPEPFDIPAISAAVPSEYHGWLLLHFGAINYANEIWQRAQTMSLSEAVHGVVERTVESLRSIQARHPQVAVWAPPASNPAKSSDIVIGTPIERNLAIVTFISMLRNALTELGIPLLSLTETMIAPDGTTLADSFEDGVHLSQALLPQALQLIKNSLGLSLSLEPSLALSEQRLSNFETVERVAKFGLEWTQIVLPGPAVYVSEALILNDVFATLKRITFASTMDDDNYPSCTLEFRGPVGGPKNVTALPIHNHAKKLLFWAEGGWVNAEDLSIYIKVSPLHGNSGYNRDSIFALRDLLAPPTQIPVLSGEVAPRKGKKLTAL